MPELIKTEAGPLAGHTIVAIDWDKLAAFKSACYAAHVPYLWGGKDPKCGQGFVDFPGIDCSGFARTILMYATGGPVSGAMRHMPDGSYTQGQWLAAKGFKQTDPSNCANSDGHLRCCVHYPDHLDEVGHIWLAVNGHSIESWGHHGPGERAWNARLSSGHTLDDLASVCFVLC